MIHPATRLQFIRPEIGHGVIATERIPRGTIVWARCDLDQTITPARFVRLRPVYRKILERYAYVDGAGDWVLCWDHARFMNHSCNPTCLSPGYPFEVAVRDIEPGEELTDEYGGLNLHEAFECQCGSERCRGRVEPDDLLRFHEEWDRKIAQVFPLIAEAPQPLWPFVRQKRAVQAAIETGHIRSAMCHFHALAGAGAGRGALRRRKRAS